MDDTNCFRSRCPLLALATPQRQSSREPQAHTLACGGAVGRRGRWRWDLWFELKLLLVDRHRTQAVCLQCAAPAMSLAALQ